MHHPLAGKGPRWRPRAPVRPWLGADSVPLLASTRRTASRAARHESGAWPPEGRGVIGDHRRGDRHDVTKLLRGGANRARSPIRSPRPAATGLLPLRVFVRRLPQHAPRVPTNSDDLPSTFGAYLMPSRDRGGDGLRCDAIHPGYGSSPRAAILRRCAPMRLTFVGDVAHLELFSTNPARTRPWRCPYSDHVSTTPCHR